MKALKMIKHFFIRMVKLFCVFQLLFASHISMADQKNNTVLLKEMFQKVTLEKNDKAIPVYYGKQFELYSNGKKMTYDEFLKMHHDVFKTNIQYNVRYDEDTFVEQGNKVAGRLFITTKKADEPAHEIEVILVAEYKDHKLSRLWELTYPDWSQLKAFQKATK